MLLWKRIRDEHFQVHWTAPYLASIKKVSGLDGLTVTSIRFLQSYVVCYGPNYDGIENHHIQSGETILFELCGPGMVMIEIENIS